MENNLKQRNGCITAWLWVAILLNIGMAIFYAVSMFSAYSTEMALGFGICSIFGMINVLGATLLMRWNKTGFYLFLVSSLISAVVNVFVLKMSPVTAISSVFAIVIWWTILQAKKDGVSAWSQLETGWDYKHTRHLYQVFSIIGIALFVLTLIAVGMEHKNPYADILSEYEAVEEDTVAVEEVVEVVEVEETVAEKNMRFLNSMIEQTNREYPQKLEEGITMERIFLEGDYVVYQAKVDEDVIDMDLLEMNKKNMKLAIKENLSASDPEIKMFKNTCTKAEKGIAYKYVGDTSGQSVYIRFSCDELKNMN